MPSSTAKTDLPPAAGQPLRDTASLAPGLYLVATPIGNLGDLTARAGKILAAADLVACEDTRVTGRLLAHLGARTPMQAYHEHNAEQVRPLILARLRQGARVALVSDAGTPLVSDPGYKLVRAAIAEGLAVTAAPGANAALTALVLSGLPTDRFLFLGFLPPRQAARRAAIAEVAAVRASLVLYETAPRLADCLADLAAILGDRPAAVARELTKLFEEVRRDRLSALAGHYAEAGPPRGEIAVVVGPPEAAVAPPAADIDRLLAEALAAGEGVRAAAARLAAETGLPRRDLYQRAIALGRPPEG
ncbi:MAG: 16S rRNA (cytidine(1402)-2'-O)-methyltransferase [Thalassobaculales bacterium]